MPKVALPPIADWTLGTGLENYGSGIIRLTKWGRLVVSDDFSDSSLDTGNFTAVTDGVGTVAETTTLTITTAAANDSAFVHYNTALTTNGVWKIKIKAKLTTFTANFAAIFSLFRQAAAPTADSTYNATTVPAFTLWHHTSNTVLTVRAHLSSGTSLIWRPSIDAFQATYTDGTNTANTYYWYVFESDGRDLWFKMYSDDESTIDTTYGSVRGNGIRTSWDSIANPNTSENIWATFGDIYTGQGAGVVDVNGFWHYGAYVTTSPEGESPWIAIDSSTLDGTTALDLVANPLGGTGTINYQYATNNGAYNGSWVSEAAMNTALLDLAITDHTNSLRIKAQFVSTGDQPAELGIASYIQADAIAGGGGGGVFAY